jgi:hypothetical protein
MPWPAPVEPFFFPYVHLLLSSTAYLILHRAVRTVMILRHTSTTYPLLLFAGLTSGVLCRFFSFFMVVHSRTKTMRKRCWELRAKYSHGSWVLMYCACGFETYWLPVIPFSLMLLPGGPVGHCGVYTGSANDGTRRLYE